MTLSVAVGQAPLTRQFAPFGAIIDKPAQFGEREFFSDWLGGPGLSPILHVNHMPAASLPVTLASMERHPHAAQCFLPLDVSRYLVTVAPSLPDGSADIASLQSFILPGSLGVIYAQGVWHAGASVLDRAGAFAVLMWRGAVDDDVFAAIPPIQLIPALAMQDQGAVT